MVNLYIYIWKLPKSTRRYNFCFTYNWACGHRWVSAGYNSRGTWRGSHFVFVWKNERVSNDSNLPWGKHMIKLHREICLISMKCAGPILVEPYFSCKRSWLWIYHLQNRLMRNVPLSCLSKGRFPPCNSTDITSPWRRTRHGGSAMWIICFLEYGNQWT